MLPGKTTARGTRVSFTRGCRIQASGDGSILQSQQIPFGDLPPLRARSAVYVKYYEGPNIFGLLWVRGAPESVPEFQQSPSGYPLRNFQLAPKELSRKSRRVLLPVTSSVPVYAQNTNNFEPCVALEF